MKEAEGTIVQAALDASGIISKENSAPPVEQVAGTNSGSQGQPTPTEAPPGPDVPASQAEDLEKKYKALQADYTRQAQARAEAERKLATLNPPSLDAAKKAASEPEGISAMRTYLEAHPELYAGTDPVRQTQFTENIAANIARAIVNEDKARQRDINAAMQTLGLSDDSDFANPEFESVYRVVVNGYKASGPDFAGKNPALGAWGALYPDKVAEIKRTGMATANERVVAKASARVERPTASRPAEIPPAKVDVTAEELCLSISKRMLGEE